MKNPAFSPIRGPDPANFAHPLRRWANCFARDAYDACPNGPATRAFALVFTLVLAMLINLLASVDSARAQQAGLMSNGDLVVTGFSGTTIVGDQTFIDTNRASLNIRDVSGKGSPQGQLVDAPIRFEAFARDIGQVFGVALDNAPNPNIYATATSVHGLRIVIPDNNGDGVPEVVQTGQAGATFMDGQFGAALGGSPGTVWRIDGTTGEISKFAEITSGGLPNSGPGLGNITFDPAHYQFYVSDLDTGNIYSLDLAGNNLGSFDHGTQGRPQAGLAPVGLDAGKRMDITSPAFDAANPTTWGLADERRRAWGLAYHSGRLFYAVDAGSQVWSVSINEDGSFGGDARVEIEAVVGGKPVSDILFTPQGRMIVAQRGGIQNAADYSLYHVPSANRVLRYSRDENGEWIQQADEYAIGFPADHKQASGGAGLACDGTLWSTGDALRNDPAIAGFDPLVVHGLQGNHLSRVRPANVPPRVSWFVDHDGYFEDPEKAGHVGDVEVYRDCSGGRAESWPGWYPVPEWYPPEGWIPPVWWPRTPDLDIEKYAQQCEYVLGLFNTVECTYIIVVTNNGAADWIGHLNVTDNPQANAIYIPPAGGSIPWTCNQPGGAGTAIDCQSDNVENLHPGESETLEITVRITNPDMDKLIRNCAEVDDPFDFWPNRDCDETELPRPDLDIQKTFDFCVPEGAGQRCYFTVMFQNVGGAPYNGPLSFDENVPAGTVFGGIDFSTTAGWGCIGGAPISCTLPDPPGVSMNPGDFELVGISVIVPAGMNGDYENCVNLGEPVHADDPDGLGQNESCVPFNVAAPIKHACPDGWQDVPPGGIPAGWQGIVIDGINPDGSGWSKTCMRPIPVEMPGNLKSPPVEHKCPAGWQKAPQNGVPAGWTAIIIDGINPDGTKWGIKCMKPKPQQETLPLPKCFPHEKLYASARQVPPGWTSRKVTLGNKAIWCARPGRITVPRPQCRKDEKQFPSASRIPNGWTRRSVTLGNTTIWCAKPGLTTTPDPVGPTCSSGEKQVTSPGAAPKGWTVRTVTSGKRTIYCAKPGTLTPVKPRCEGGKLVLLKSLPPKWRCICPARTALKGGKCVSTGNISPQSTPQTTVPPTLTCPKGWSNVRGKCIPPKPPVKLCPRGWKSYKGKCIPPKPQVTPQIKKPLILKPQTSTPQIKKPLILKPQSKKPAIRKLPKVTAKPEPNTGKVMMLAPSRKLR